MFSYRQKIAGLVLLVAACAVGCSQQKADSPGSKGGSPAALSSDSPGRPQDGGDGKVLFFIAASTSNVMDEVRSNFEADTGFRVELNPGASSTLARQIVHGAEADLFLAANQEWADFVATTQRGPNRIRRRVNLLSNHLVIVVPIGSRLSLTSAQGLVDPEIENLALANPDSVPAGIYAKQALRKLGLWESLRPKVVRGEDVRHAMAYVETETAQAGILYATDAAISSKVRVVAKIDPSLHEPVSYPLVLLRRAEKRRGAIEFFDYLLGPEAKKVFEKHGFTVPEAPAKSEDAAAAGNT